MSRVANQLEPDSSPGSGPRHTLGFAANRKGQKRKKRDQDRGKRDAMSAKRHKAMEEAASSPASSTASSIALFCSSVFRTTHDVCTVCGDSLAKTSLHTVATAIQRAVGLQAPLHITLLAPPYIRTGRGSPVAFQGG